MLSSVHNYMGDGIGRARAALGARLPAAEPNVITREFATPRVIFAIKSSRKTRPLILLMTFYKLLPRIYDRASGKLTMKSS